MVKKEALTTEELSDLKTFIGECVLKDKVFPTLKVGVDNVSIQELMHDRSLDSIKAFGKMVKDAISKHDPDFSSSDTFKIGGVEGDKFVRMLKYIIKYREHKAFVKEAASNRKSLERDLENLSTPEERRAKLQSQLDEIKQLELMEE